MSGNEASGAAVGLRMTDRELLPSETLRLCMAKEADRPALFARFCKARGGAEPKGWRDLMRKMKVDPDTIKPLSVDNDAASRLSLELVEAEPTVRAVDLLGSGRGIIELGEAGALEDARAEAESMAKDREDAS